MQLSAIHIGIIVTVVMLLPIVYLIINTSGKDRKVRKAITQLAQNAGADIKSLDIIGNCIIGLDANSKKLVYATKKNAASDFKVIDIANVKDFRAKSVRQTEKTLDWVGLEIVEKSGKCEIPFYNEHDENELSTDAFVCLQDAKRWESTVRPLIKAS